jgi:hypothetical protein
MPFSAQNNIYSFLLCSVLILGAIAAPLAFMGSKILGFYLLVVLIYSLFLVSIIGFILLGSYIFTQRVSPTIGKQ